MLWNSVYSGTAYLPYSSTPDKTIKDNAKRFIPCLYALELSKKIRHSAQNNDAGRAQNNTSVLGYAVSTAKRMKSEKDTPVATIKLLPFFSLQRTALVLVNKVKSVPSLFKLYTRLSGIEN